MSRYIKSVYNQFFPTSAVVVGLSLFIGLAADAHANALLWSKRCFDTINRPHVAIHNCTLALKSANLDAFNQAITLNNRGEALRRSGRYQDAILDFSAALKIRPDFAEAFGNRGAAYESQGAYKAAVQDYSQALALKPTLAKAFFGRGNALSRLGQSEAAVDDYDSAIRLAPRKGTYYFNRGLELEKLGRNQESVLDFLKAYELMPHHPMTKAKAADVRLNM